MDYFVTTKGLIQKCQLMQVSNSQAYLAINTVDLFNTLVHYRCGTRGIKISPTCDLSVLRKITYQLYNESFSCGTQPFTSMDPHYSHIARGRCPFSHQQKVVIITTVWALVKMRDRFERCYYFSISSCVIFVQGSC